MNLKVIRGNELSAAQADFLNHWSEEYFGEVAVSKGLAKAPVHWRLILEECGEMLSAVALTEMALEIDGESQTLGAVGGLLTPKPLQGLGYGNALMERTEAFIFRDLNLPGAILFCLPELVPFYARRGWLAVDHPVTLEQKAGSVVWGAAVMLLWPENAHRNTHSIHLPLRPR